MRAGRIPADLLFGHRPADERGNYNRIGELHENLLCETAAGFHTRVWQTETTATRDIRRYLHEYLWVVPLPLVHTRG